MEVIGVEVMDDGDIASVLEEAERSASISRILSDIPGKRNIDELIVENLQCDICLAYIPVERQRIVLTIHKTCDLCVDCQAIEDKKDRLFMG
jgi:RNA polymerase-binding transcription factor DksA